MFFGRWQLAGCVVVVAVAALATGLYFQSSGATSQSQSHAVATPCPTASPVVGTPVDSAATAVANPVTCLDDSMMGTPVAVDGLVINVTADDDQAGPITLTVDVSDQDGAPVEGAQVTVIARHLEMDMGAFPHEAE